MYNPRDTKILMTEGGKGKLGREILMTEGGKGKLGRESRS